MLGSTFANIQFGSQVERALGPCWAEERPSSEVMDCHVSQTEITRILPGLTLSSLVSEQAPSSLTWSSNWSSPDFPEGQMWSFCLPRWLTWSYLWHRLTLSSLPSLVDMTDDHKPGSLKHQTNILDSSETWRPLAWSESGVAFSYSLDSGHVLGSSHGGKGLS